MINSLVADLPEVYQPIYGHPELSRHVSRTSQDRLEHIARIHDAIQRLLGRPLRVLDLGCAQAYFSLNLAERGATVHGVDYLDKNVAVCNALAKENPTLQVSFETGRIEDVITRLESGQYDLMLGLSVFHHIVHEKGVAAVQDLLARAASECGALVLELALREEPLYWAPAQPEDPRSLLESIPFVHEVARHDTHLASIARPLFVASKQYWVLSGQANQFHSWSTDPHALANGVYQASRRYFFGDSHVVKSYRLDHKLGNTNLSHFTNEIAFLRNPPIGFSAPNLIVCGNNTSEAWVAMERLPGRLLLELLREDVAIDTHALLLFILKQLASLEAAGLFHNDVRTWNILVADDGAVHLIDYGSISPVAQDCVWPSNLFLAFFIFVREVVTRNVDVPDPLRGIAISPLRLPPRYRTWAESLWQRPLTEWSFNLMHQTLLNCTDDGDLNPSPDNPQDVWMQAIEEAIQAHKNFSQHINASLLATNAAHSEFKAFGEAMAASGQLAIDSASNASSIAQQAMAVSQQTRELIAGFESTLRHFQIQTNAAEQRVNALLSSTSWRATAPLRWLSTGMRKWLAFPWRVFKRVVRTPVLAAMNVVLQRPPLRRAFSAAIKRCPRLAQHLHLMAIHRGLMEKPSPPATEITATSDAPTTPLTPHAQRIHDELVRAIAQQSSRDT